MIAVLPSMIHPKQPFSDGLRGGGNQIPFDMRVHNHYCHYELHNIKSRNNFVLFHYLLLISFKSCIFIYHMVNALK